MFTTVKLVNDWFIVTTHDQALLPQLFKRIRLGAASFPVLSLLDEILLDCLPRRRRCPLMSVGEVSFFTSPVVCLVTSSTQPCAFLQFFQGFSPVWCFPNRHIMFAAWKLAISLMMRKRNESDRPYELLSCWCIKCSMPMVPFNVTPTGLQGGNTLLFQLLSVPKSNPIPLLHPLKTEEMMSLVRVFKAIYKFQSLAISVMTT